MSIGGSYYNGNDRFTTSTTRDQKRIRWGAELAMDLNAVSLKAEYIRGEEGNSNPIVHQGWYGQAACYIVPKYLQGVFRYDSYNSDLAAKSPVNSTYYDIGLNYFFNVWTKVQVYYSLRNQQGPALNNNMFEAQLQLAF